MTVAALGGALTLCGLTVLVIPALASAQTEERELSAHVQVRTEFVGGYGDIAEQGVHLEVAFLGDYHVIGTPMHFRFGAVLGLPYWSTRSGTRSCGREHCSRRRMYSAQLSVRARLIALAIDLGELFALRFAGDLGVQLVPSYRPDPSVGPPRDEFLYFLPAVTGEVVWRVAGGVAEVGAFGGFQMTATSSAGTGSFPHLVEVYVLGVQLAARLEERSDDG